MKIFTSMKYVVAALLLMVGANAMAETITWKASEQGYANAEDVLYIKFDDVISATLSAGTNANGPKYYNTGSALRLYGANSITFSGSTITEIEFTFASGEGTNEITANTGSYANGTWTGADESVTFTIGGSSGHRRIAAITITYGDGVAVPRPVITPATGVYTEAQTVSISVEAGLTAYYTLNGGAETKYTAPFTVSETTTVVAYAMDADGNKSSTVTSVITIANIGNLVGSGTTADPYNVASAMELINAGLAPTEKVYVKGIVTKIDEISIDYGNATYWIGDTANDGNPLEVYRGYGLGGEKFTSADALKVGDNVIVGGTLILYGTTPEFTTGSEIYELNGEKVGEKETTAYESISAIKAAATATKEPASLKLDNLLVSYVNGNYTYVTDGTEGFLLFGTTGVKAGDKLAGTATGDLYLYNGLPEMALTSADGITVVSSGNEVSVPVYELGDVQGNGMRYSNLLVKFDGVYFNASALTDKNVSIEQDGNEVTLRDNFNLLTGVEFDTEALYTFTAIVAIYNGAVQLYPINRADFVTEAPYDFVGDGTAENPYTVADVQHFDVTTASAPVWVKGIIVGCANSTLKNFYPVVEGVAAVDTNVLLAATEGETNVDKCIPVNLANSPAAMKAVRETLNVRDHAENIGKEVIVHGTIEKYFSVAGVKNVDDAIIDGTEVNSIVGVNTDAVRAQGIYTVAGQRVNNVTRGGLYIIGGQKVLVK